MTPTPVTALARLRQPSWFTIFRGYDKRGNLRLKEHLVVHVPEQLSAQILAFEKRNRAVVVVQVQHPESVNQPPFLFLKQRLPMGLTRWDLQARTM